MKNEKRKTKGRQTKREEEKKRVYNQFILGMSSVQISPGFLGV